MISSEVKGSVRCYLDFLETHPYRHTNNLRTEENDTLTAIVVLISKPIIFPSGHLLKNYLIVGNATTTNITEFDVNRFALQFFV